MGNFKNKKCLCLKKCVRRKIGVLNARQHLRVSGKEIGLVQRIECFFHFLKKYFLKESLTIPLQSDHFVRIIYLLLLFVGIAAPSPGRLLAFCSSISFGEIWGQIEPNSQHSGQGMVNVSGTELEHLLVQLQLITDHFVGNLSILKKNFFLIKISVLPYNM